MELETCNNDFTINNEIGNKKKEAVKNDSNNSTFTKILNKTIKDEEKIKVSKEEITCKLKPKEQNGIKEIHVNEPLGCNRMETRNRSDAVVSKLAGFFGIGVNLMMAILQSIGLTPEDLIDETKKPLILELLTKFFLLNNKKKEELEKLLETC